MKPVDDELFAQIKECLTEHEEVYTPGAWERFEKKGSNKTRRIWLASLSSAAALALIGFGLFYTSNFTQVKEIQHAKNTSSEQNIDGVQDGLSETSEPLTAIENLKTEITENKNIQEQRVMNNVPANPLIVKVRQATSVAAPADIVDQPLVPSVKENVSSSEKVIVPGKTGLEGQIAVLEMNAKTDVKEKDTAKNNKPLSFEEFLDAEVKTNSALAALKSPQKKADKWEMGLMVAPSMGNAKKLNMGYGLSMDYALSDKVSISSGVSYNELGATKIAGGNGAAMDAPTNKALVQDTKSLKSVDANLVGIDIPLGIKYYLSKKFYTNFGVSAFAVLNQKQNNNYVKGGVEYASAPDQVSSAGFKAFFQERAVSEAVPSGEIRGDKYLGFYNVSFGFKQPISGSKAFSVEPFMKLPMKEFTKENLYLIGTGVRLKFDF